MKREKTKVKISISSRRIKVEVLLLYQLHRDRPLKILHLPHHIMLLLGEFFFRENVSETK